MGVVATGVLNEGVTSPGVDHTMFVSWRKVRLEAGTRLAKFTEHELFKGGPVSAWWAFWGPGPHGDPGLEAELRRLVGLRGGGASVAAAVRDAYAVMFEWNRLANAQSGLVRVQRVRLVKPAWGFHGKAAPVEGRCAPLASAPKRGAPAFPGGAYQLNVPNLTGEHVVGEGLVML